MSIKTPPIRPYETPLADAAPRLPNLNRLPLADFAQLHRETEENAAECDRLLLQICQKAKALIKNYGKIRDKDTLENLVHAVKYLADVDDLPEEERIPALVEFKRQVRDSNSPIWDEINDTMEKWSGGKGLW